MMPRSVNLRGLTLAEAEAKVREFVANVQEKLLANFEIDMIDWGADPDDLATELARQRAELVQLREVAMKRWRVMAERGGKPLN